MTGKALTGRVVTRRAAVAAGLGALACAPAAALAETLTRFGYRSGGEAWDGLVTVEGKTYLFEAGVKFCGGEKEFRGSRYFWPGDGRMAVDEDTVWVSDGSAHHYNKKGLLEDKPEITVGENEIDGKWYWVNEDGSRFCGWRHIDDGDRWCYFSPADGGARASGEAFIPCDNTDGADSFWYYFEPERGACWHGWRDSEDGRRLYYDQVGGWMHHGWFELDGAKYCADPVTGDVARGCKRVDPTRPERSQFGSIYQFDDQGRATWYRPCVEDLDGTGPSAPVPSGCWGDERQRSVLWALSRIGCPYVQNVTDGTGFVCDGLTGWAVTNGTDGRIVYKDGVDRIYQDMAWQHEYIRNKNGMKTDWSQLKCGDIIFWGDASQIENKDTWGSRHVSMYYGFIDGRRYMVHTGDPIHNCCLALMDDEQAGFGDFIDFGSPYDEPVSEVEVEG